MPTPLVARSLKPDTVGLPLRYHLSAAPNHHSNMLPMAKDEPVAKTSQSTIRILIKRPPTGGADWPSARAGDGGRVGKGICRAKRSPHELSSVAFFVLAPSEQIDVFGFLLSKASINDNVQRRVAQYANTPDAETKDQWLRT
jgi:hypothetical protein